MRKSGRKKKKKQEEGEKNRIKGGCGRREREIAIICLFLTAGNTIKGMFDPVPVSPRGAYLFLWPDGKSLSGWNRTRLLEIFVRGQHLSSCSADKGNKTSLSHPDWRENDGGAAFRELFFRVV